MLQIETVEPHTFSILKQLMEIPEFGNGDDVPFAAEEKVVRNMKKAISFFILIAMACSACKKEVGVTGPVGPQGDQGPLGVNHDTASISGSLSLFNALSWPVGSYRSTQPSSGPFLSWA